MIKIKQIRENYDIITEKENLDVSKLTSLVRAGLFDAKKLPILKRALEKDPNKLTPSERKILLELLDSLMSEVLHSQQVYSKVKQNVRDLSEVVTKDYLSKYDPRYEAGTSEKELPSVIILQRKAIRIFPGRQKVGLYYSQSLDRYVSIPFGPGVPNMNEDVNLNEISTEYKMRKLGNYASKDADIEDDESKDEVSKSLETAKRQVRTKKFLKKAFKDKNERDVASKFADKSVERRREYLKSYDAPKKKGQVSNLTKGWLKGDVGTAEYVGTKIGSAVSKMFARKKKPTTSSVTPAPTTPSAVKPTTPSATTATTTPPATTKPTQKLTSKQQSVLANVQKRKKSAVAIATKAKSSTDLTDPQKQKKINMARRYASYAQRDRRKVGIKESFIDKLNEIKTQQIDEIAPLIPLAIGAAARVAAPVIGRAVVGAAKGAAKGLSRGTKFQRFRARARGLGRKLDASGIGPGSKDQPNSGSSVPERKFTTPGEFKLQTKTSTPKGQTKTGYENRMDSKYRQSLEQPVSESIKLVSEGNYDSYDLNIGENKVTINTSIAKKINTLYESLNDNNKKKLKKMLNEGNIESFKKVLEFAVR